MYLDYCNREEIEVANKVGYCGSADDPRGGMTEIMNTEGDSVDEQGWKIRGWVKEKQK